jgi:hypothetical protein
MLSILYVLCSRCHYIVHRIQKEAVAFIPGGRLNKENIDRVEKYSAARTAERRDGMMMTIGNDNGRQKDSESPTESILAGIVILRLLL